MPKSGIRSLFVFVFLFALAFLFYSQIVVPARESARIATCRNNMRQIVLALHNCESAFGSLPLAIDVDDNGKLLRSWRSYIYPTFMESSQQHYDDTQPWDSPKNNRLLNGTPVTITDKGGANPRLAQLEPFPRSFCCPSVPAKHRLGVNYVVVVGDLTAFPVNATIKFDEITDGLENTILVVESNSCNPHWTEPVDLIFDTMNFQVNGQDGQGISSSHPGGANVCFADGATFFLTIAVSPDDLRALLTISGGEHVTRVNLIERGILIQK